MSSPDFVYTTYIRTTPEKLWNAITNPEFTRQYWSGYENSSDWKVGSEWKHIGDDEKHTVRVVGKVLESVPPTRLVITWAEPGDLADVSQVTFEITPLTDMVCLKVLHGGFTPGSKMAPKISMGWPRVLASMKSFLETGEALVMKNMK